MERQAPGRPEKTSQDGTITPTLENMGLSRNEAHRWQVEAEVPKDRIALLGRHALEALRAYIRAAPFDFAPGAVLWRCSPRGPGQAGAPMTRQSIGETVAYHARRAGLGSVRAHALRHCFATHLLAGGADLVSIAELLGHASLNTTMLYIHLDTRRLAEVHRRHHPRA